MMIQLKMRYEPWRDVDLNEPRFERLVQENVKAKQLVTAEATAHVADDHTVDVAFSTDTQTDTHTLTYSYTHSHRVPTG